MAFQAKRSGSQSMACHSFISSAWSFSDSVKYRSDQPELRWEVEQWEVGQT